MDRPLAVARRPDQHLVAERGERRAEPAPGTGRGVGIGAHASTGDAVEHVDGAPTRHAHHREHVPRRHQRDRTAAPVTRWKRVRVRADVSSRPRVDAMHDIAPRSDHDFDAKRDQPGAEAAGERREGVRDGPQQHAGGEVEDVDLVEPRLADDGERPHQGHRRPEGLIVFGALGRVQERAKMGAGHEVVEGGRVERVLRRRRADEDVRRGRRHGRAEVVLGRGLAAREPVDARHRGVACGRQGEPSEPGCDHHCAQNP